MSGFEKALWGLVAALTLTGCAALLEPSGSGETVTDPVTGVERAETKGDAVVSTVSTVGTILSPSNAPLLALAGILARGAIGVAAGKKKV